MTKGGAIGVCCQKVSEAEALVRGGVGNVLIANEVTEPVITSYSIHYTKLYDRLAAQ